MPYQRMAICALVVLAIGCASIKEMRKTKNFDETTRAYANALRWSDFKVARAYLKISSSAENPPDLEFLNQFKVVDYEVEQTVPSGEQQTVHQVVTIRYYRSDESLVKKLTINEVWEYDMPMERWFLISGFPAFE